MLSFMDSRCLQVEFRPSSLASVWPPLVYDEQQLSRVLNRATTHRHILLAQPDYWRTLRDAQISAQT